MERRIEDRVPQSKGDFQGFNDKNTFWRSLYLKEIFWACMARIPSKDLLLFYIRRLCRWSFLKITFYTRLYWKENCEVFYFLKSFQKCSIWESPPVVFYIKTKVHWRAQEVFYWKYPFYRKVFCKFVHTKKIFTGLLFEVEWW